MKIGLLLCIKCSTRTSEKTDILPSFVTDHSPILFSLNQMIEFSQGKGLWKFKKSLLLNKEYVEKIKEHILLKIKMSDNDDLKDEEVRWQHLKYEIRKFTIRFSKILAKEVRKETISRGKSSVTKLVLLITINTIYSKKVNRIRIRSVTGMNMGKNLLNSFLILKNLAHLKVLSVLF